MKIAEKQKSQEILKIPRVCVWEYCLQRSSDSLETSTGGYSKGQDVTFFGEISLRSNFKNENKKSSYPCTEFIPTYPLSSMLPTYHLHDFSQWSLTAQVIYKVFSKLVNLILIPTAT